MVFATFSMHFCSCLGLLASPLNSGERQRFDKCWNTTFFSLGKTPLPPMGQCCFERWGGSMHGKHFSLGQAFNTDSGGRGEVAKIRVLRNKMFHTLYQNVVRGKLFKIHDDWSKGIRGFITAYGVASLRVCRQTLRRRDEGKFIREKGRVSLNIELNGIELCSIELN